MRSAFLFTMLIGCVMSSELLAETTSSSELPAIKIVLCGDSTVQDYPLPNERRGWGQVIGEYLSDKVTIINLAAGGRSTKTFISEKRLENALSKQADYAMIQFGHNDSHEKGRPESTDADGDYKDYLKQYIDAFSAQHVKMVFITPMHRRIFRKDGSMAQTLNPYRMSMMAMSDEYKQPCVDLFIHSEKLFMAIGPDKSEYLSCNNKDRSHFSPKGAQAMALCILKDLQSQQHPLAAYIKPDVAAMLQKTDYVDLAPKADE